MRVIDASDNVLLHSRVAATTSPGRYRGMRQLQTRERHAMLQSALPLWYLHHARTNHETQHAHRHAGPHARACQTGNLCTRIQLALRD